MYNPQKDEKGHLISIWYCRNCRRYFIQQGSQNYDEFNDNGFCTASYHPCSYCNSEETHRFSDMIDTTAPIIAYQWLCDNKGECYKERIDLYNHKMLFNTDD